MKVCLIEGCGLAHHTRGLCNMHSARMRRRGTTVLPEEHSPTERLTAGLVRMPNGCLEWTGAINDKGYGHIRVDGKTVKTHRLAWTLANGPIPDGLVVRHFVCDNPPCCDPEHLRPGTQAENLADMAAKCRSGPRTHGTATKTRLTKGTP